MRTIVKPKGHIRSLWGQQRIRDGEQYRLMRYVLRVDHDGKVLLHNVVTGQLAELDQAEAEALNRLPAAYAPAMEQLVNEHYLVPEGFDEFRSVNQLRKILQSRSTGSAINHYVILPTTFCNARCFYCYESDYPRVHMTEETARRLIDYIDGHREGKDVSINWFGGEPLVGIQRIDQISQGLKDRGIPFSSTMISNGYLFDEEIIKRSAELWKLQRVQITLDGTENTYNRVKAYSNAQDNPFRRVLRNIDLLTGRKIQVNIRLNVDFYNREDIRDLIEELGRRYSDNEYVTAYLNMLFSDQGFEPVKHTYDDMLKLMDIISGYTERLKELKLSFDSGKYLNLSWSQCMADNPHTVMIQPDGSFCRCEHENISDSYGSLEDGVTQPQKLEKWKETVLSSDRCPECGLYPACYQLRHCMNSERPCFEKLQIANLKQQKERVLAMYRNRMEAEKNESV